MNFKVTLGIWDASTKEEAIEKVNEMLDAYDLQNFEGDDGVKVEINWLEDGDGIEVM
jgi:hypothetical protein